MYARLGVNCTHAITSNNKHILPQDAVYGRRYTHMTQYPGVSNTMSFRNDTDPELLRTYHSKVTAPKSQLLPPNFDPI